MLRVIIVVVQIHQPMIIIHRKEIATHTLVNKGIAKMNTLHHQITVIHTAIAIIDNMVMKIMETIGKFIMRPYGYRLTQPTKLASIILLIASFNVNAQTTVERNNQLLADEDSRYDTTYTPQRTPYDIWVDKRVAEMKDEKALELQQQEQRLRIQEQQLRIQEQQRYMNQ